MRFGVGVALLAGIVVFLGPDWGEVRERLEIQPAWFLLGLGGTAAASVFGALRWRILNEHLTPTRLPFATYFHYIALTRLIGQFSSMLLMDLVGRGVGLRAAGSKQGLGRLLTPVILERVADLLFPCFALAWAFWVHTPTGPHDGWVSTLVGALLVAAFCIVWLIRPAARVILWAYGVVSRWRGRDFEQPDVVVPRRLAVTVTLLGLGRYVAVLTQFIGIGAAVGAIRDVGLVASAFPVSQLSAVLAVTPGGLGVQDAGWAGALAWQAVDKTSIAMFLLALHSGIIVNFGILSVLSLPFGGRRSSLAPPEPSS